MIWLIASALTWIIDIEGIFTVKQKILIPTVITIFMFLFRVAIWLMMGE
jgi:hypothetical protein